MLVRWVAGTNDSLTKCLMIQLLFFLFIISCKILCKNCFNLFFYLFYKFTKIKIKSFECPKSMKNYLKKNTWNIRHLVHDSFVPSSKRPRVLYCKLTDFRSNLGDIDLSTTFRWFWTCNKKFLLHSISFGIVSQTNVGFESLL